MDELGADVKILASFLLNKTEMVAGYISPFKGKAYVHIRALVPSLEDDDWIPTRKGVAIEASRFSELRDLVLKLWDSSGDMIVGRIEKSKSDAIFVTLSCFKGTYYCHVRNYYRNGDDEWLPTKKGISIPTTRLPDLDDLFERVAEALEGAGEASTE